MHLLQRSVEIAELKTFYQQKLRAHDEQLRNVMEKLKYYESRYPEDDFMVSFPYINTNICI